ncbi:MAG: hypothetical protein ABH842_00075 [Candidatus Micrarchaeota archaeon]
MVRQELTKLQRRFAEMNIHAARRKKPAGVELRVCDPQGEQESRLFNHLAKVEPLLSERAGKRPLSMIVCLTDKSRQTALNKLGGTREAGDQTVDAYWDMVTDAADLVVRANRKKKVEAHVIRVSPSSDEGIMLLFGEDLDHVNAYQVSHALEIARERLRLREYTYDIRVGYGSAQEEYQLDLEAFSRILRHHSLVVACDRLISRPRIIIPHSQGFIREEIRKLEDSELSFYHLLPESFKVHGNGLAEVDTPFDTNLERLDIRNAVRGAFVEIKFGVRTSDTRELLQCIDDRTKDKIRGTRKGYAEVYSGQFGMRGFNTFIGKAQANRILTAVAKAVHDVAAEIGCKALPVNGCYLRYWIDFEPTEENARLLERMIATRLEEQLRSSASFKPNVSIMGTHKVWINELRARFILQTLGHDGKPFTVLDRVDFLINFIENVNPLVQKQIFDELGNNGTGKPHLNPDDRRYLKYIRTVCSRRRTIRDTEDFVWTIRQDQALPREIKVRRELIEDWLFRFAETYSERMFRDLTRTIDRMKKNRDGKGSGII